MHEPGQQLTSAAVDAGKSLEALLIEDGRKDGLVELGVNEALVIQCHQPLDQGRPAPGWSDDEDRFANFLAEKTPEKKAVQQPAERYHDPHYPVNNGKKNDVSPATEAELRLTKSQVPARKNRFKLVYIAIEF